jgi:hypothetical protein
VIFEIFCANIPGDLPDRNFHRRPQRSQRLASPSVFPREAGANRERERRRREGLLQGEERRSRARDRLVAYAPLRACSLLWTVRSIYDLRRMPYGWRRCEQSYNSVDAQKADCEKTFPGRFTTNHSIVCSQNVPKCFRSDHRTISSTLLCFDEEVGRLLSLAVAPVTLANDGFCISRSVFSSP